jgi:hypothetical protein
MTSRTVDSGLTQDRGGRAAPGEASGDETGTEGVASPGARFNLVKVFSATKARDRESIGEHVTAWLAAHPAAHVVRAQVTQSSDAEFHCLSIILFCAS